MRVFDTYLVLFSTLILSFSGVAQSKKELAKLPVDNPNIKVLWDSLCVLNNQNKYYEAVPILHTLERDALKVGEIEVYIHVLENLATLHTYKGEFDLAITYYLKAYDSYEEVDSYPESYIHKNRCTIFARLADIYRLKGDIKKGLYYAYEGKKLLKYTSSKKPFLQLHNYLGVLHHLNGQFDSSYHYRKIFLEHIEPKDTNALNSANLGMASSFISIYDYDKAGEYMQTALQYTDKEKYPLNYAITLGEIGDLEMLKGNSFLAEKKMKACIQILEKSKNNFQRLLKYYPLYADILIKNNKLERSAAILAKAETLIQEENHSLKINYYFPKWDLAIRKKDADLSKEIYEQITPLLRADQLSNSVRFYALESRFFKLIGKDDKALTSLTKSVNLKDKLRSIKNVRAIENLELKYDTQKKDIEIYAANDLIRFQTYGMIIGGVMLLSLLFLLLRNTRNRKKILRQNSFITNSLSEKEILLKEIHHRVKNNLQVISSLLSIQSRSIKNIKAKEAILEGRTRVHSMSLIHQDLYKKDNLTGVRMDRYLGNLTRDLLETYNVSEGKISLNNNIEPLKLDVESVIPLGLIVNELMSNALKYAFPEDRDGSIEVILKEEDGYLYLQVGDNGIGLDEKQLKVKQDSFGHTLIKAFRNKLDAEINISANEGTIVSLKIAKYKKVV